MGFTENKIRNFFLFSTILSAIALVVSIFTKLPKVSLGLAAALTFIHLPLLWMVQKQTQPGKRLDARIQNPNVAPVGFLISLSIFSSGLGFFSWIFLFDPASLVRNVLLMASPVIGWSVGVALYLLASLGAIMNEEDDKRDGLLIGSVLFSVVGHLFLLWLSAQIFSFTIDDAYITFRYSKNLAAGFGPTYNPGMPPVEGYTTFLWMLVMTLPHFVGVNVATFSKVLGILLTNGTFLLIALTIFTLARQIPGKVRLFFGAFAGYLLAMLPISAIHAISGMETTLFIFLLSLMVYMMTKGILDNSRLVLWAPLVGLGIGMTRPEGNAIVLLLLTCGWFLSDPTRRKRLTWFSIGLYMVPGAIYFLWRYQYYDLFLPVPFYLKVIHEAGLGGLNDVGTYLLYLLPSISVLLLVTIMQFRKAYLIPLVPAAFLLIFYIFPIHYMGFNWRFIYPAAPFIMILAAIGGAGIFNLLRGQLQPGKPWGLLIAIGLLLLGTGNLQDLDETIKNQNFYGAGISSYKTFGTALNEYNNKHEMTLAIGDAGTVPYYSDWQVIDLFGLNTTEIAFRTVSVPTLLFEQQPVDLILLSVGPNPNRISDEHAGSQKLYEEALQNGMKYLGDFPFGRVNNLWVLGYPDTELANYLQENMDFRELP